MGAGAGAGAEIYVVDIGWGRGLGGRIVGDAGISWAADRCVWIEEVGVLSKGGPLNYSKTNKDGLGDVERGCGR